MGMNEITAIRNHLSETSTKIVESIASAGIIKRNLALFEELPEETQSEVLFRTSDLIAFYEDIIFRQSRLLEIVIEKFEEDAKNDPDKSDRTQADTETT